MQSHGVSTGRALRIFNKYGPSTIAKVSENPYCLARDIDGIGFKSADRIAQNLGFSKSSMIRMRAGIQYVLNNHVGVGHCAYPIETLLAQVGTLLEAEENTLREALELELMDRYLVQDKIEEQACVYPAALHFSENQVALELCRLARGPVPWGKVNMARALEWAEDRIALALAESQREAIEKALSLKLLIITGGPGTGKTTITRAIVSILKRKNTVIAACSPTGRAAKRLSDVMGIDAKTIHRLLGYNPKIRRFNHDNNNPITCDLIIVDEMSMIDIALMYRLLRALPSHAAILFIGDVDQLPSVGPGAVLRALIDSGQIPVVRLMSIFRQAAESKIVSNAHRINRGLYPELAPKGKESDFYFIPCKEPKKTIAILLDLVKNRIPQRFLVDPMTEIQVLCPMNRGGLGTRTLNQELQKALNPFPSASVEYFGSKFGMGDKVMVTSNNYDKEVFNGDMGFITKVDSQRREMTTEIDGREVIFGYGELDILSLAYAVSIHKAQGSEYPVVVLPIALQHHVMLKRNLVYTAVTRGKKLVVLIGQEHALAKAITSDNQRVRWNKLAERVREAFGKKDYSLSLDLNL